MEAILYYIGKVTVISGVLLLYYQLFLKEKTFHRFNRFFLLVSTLCSLTIPLINLDYFILPVNQEVFSVLSEFKNTGSQLYYDRFNILPVLVLGLVALFFVSRFIFGSYKIIRLKKIFPKEIYEDILFYRTNLQNAPFSYFRNLFWKDSITVDSTIGRYILEHEMVHIRQKHTYDKLFIELVKCIFWFNPFFYIIKREIHLVHEYLADRIAVPKSDTAAFAQMLLTSHFSSSYSPAINPLLNSSVKKRIKMLKASTTRFSYFRFISLLPAVLAIVIISMLQLRENGLKAIDALTVSLVHTYKDSSGENQQTILLRDSTIEKATERRRRSVKNHDKESSDIAQVNKILTSGNVERDMKPTEIEDEARNFNLDKQKYHVYELQKIRKAVDQVMREAQLARSESEEVQKDAEQVARDAKLARSKATTVSIQAMRVRKNVQQLKATI